MKRLLAACLVLALGAALIFTATACGSSGGGGGGEEGGGGGGGGGEATPNDWDTMNWDEGDLAVAGEGTQR